MSKISSQMSIPFEVPKSEIKKYAEQHWKITFAKQRKVAPMSKRIMANVLAQIKKEDTAFKPYYQMHISDVISDDMVLKGAYTEVRKAFSQLTDLKWLIEDLENNKFAYRHLLDTTHAECGYNNGTITIALNPLLKDYFIALSHYTSFELKAYNNFNAWYSMRLYEILSAFKDKGYWMVEINEFRKFMDCENKYVGNDSVMIVRTTTKALEELKGTDCEFTVKILREKNPMKKGQPAIIGLGFTLKNRILKTIPERWYEDPEHADVFNRLKKYKVTEYNIIKYAGLIGFKECKELVYQWDIKQAQTKDRIQNPESYCNKVFSDKGKAILDAKK